MKLKNLRKHSRRTRWVEGIFKKNPVLIGGLALPFAVMITDNLKNSVAISIVMMILLIPNVLLAYLMDHKLPQWGGVMLHTLFSMALVVASVPWILPLSPEILDSLGIYLPLLSMNTVLLSLCSRYANNKKKPLLALADALSYGIGFALAICGIAFLRELLGNNTIWGTTAWASFKMHGLQIAFAGFILIAILGALLRFARRTLLLILYRCENPKEQSAAAEVL